MSALAAKSSGSFSFGPFVLVPERQLLLQNGVRVRVGRRAFDILLALVQRPGEVVSKQELISQAWPNVFVEEGNLKVNIAALRQLLGEKPGPPRYIATVVGRGYKFVASVQFSGVGCSAPMRCSQPKRANNLLVQDKRIFGRAETVSSILRELESCRLISIIGPGGAGKTTVALAVADAAMELFDAGVWLVELASLADPSNVPISIAAAIGAKIDSPTMPDTLFDYLRDRKMLLVLDNCEHIIDGIAYWADRILRHAKNVSLLITSREPLCVNGERVRRLSGLGLPPFSEQINVEDALAFPAVQLFVDRASNKCSSFRLDDGNAPIVAEICRRLDGLALAIDRVASRVNALDVGKLLDHLDRRFLMFDGYHTGPERHRTLTAALDWSYDRLPASEQTVMRRLSTFSGAFSLESACAVVGGHGVERAQIIEGVASLVAKSLLLGEVRDGEMEYRQTHVTQAFALEKLIESGELQSTRRRHAEHVLDLTERATRCAQSARSSWQNPE